jgi:hypothetical protein
VWIRPFLWILLAPLFTVPATVLLLLVVKGQPGDCLRGLLSADPDPCTAVQATLALLPGLCNLGAAWWLRAPAPEVWRAAALATGLGALRLLVPVGLLGWEGSSPYPGVYWWVALVSVGLWILSLLVTVGYGIWLHVARR